MPHNMGFRVSKSLFTLCLGACLLLSIAQAKQVENSSVGVDTKGTTTYLGNEALLVENSVDGVVTKVLFDPFFHQHYNNYQLVPDDIKAAIMQGKPPYDGITAIFVSHAHGDHFAADELAKYLNLHKNTKLVTSKQAIDELVAHDSNIAQTQLVPIKLAYRDPAIKGQVGNVQYDAARIPHAGWPQRADVSNLLFRVTLNDTLTVIHMGDADPDDAHFAPLQALWDEKVSDTAYPPYWFFVSREGPVILKDRLKAKNNIGIHVPTKVPLQLLDSGARFYHSPGEETEH